MAIVVKNPLANAGDVRETGSTPGSGRFPGRGYGDSLWYSCLENSMNGGTWRATVHRNAKSQIWLKRLSTHTHAHLFMAMLALRCCAQAFSSCNNWGLFFNCSVRWLLLLQSMGSKSLSFTSCGSWPSVVGAQGVSFCGMGLIALLHIESSKTRDRTHVAYIDRLILNHWTTREVWAHNFKIKEHITVNSAWGLMIIPLLLPIS